MKATLNPQQAKLQASYAHPGTLYASCYDAEAARLYGAGSDAAIYSVDLSAEKSEAEKKWTHHENYISSLVPCDGMLISGGYDRQLVWTNIESGEKLRSVEAHDGWIRAIALLSDRKRLASIGDDMLVKLWDVESGRLIRFMEGHARKTPEGYATALYALAVSPDGKTLASGDRIGEVVLWETDTGKEISRLQAPVFYTFDSVKRARAIGGIRSLCFSPDGTKLAIGGIGKVSNVDGFVGPCRVEVWDPHAGERKFVGQDGHKAILNHLAFHPEEPLLIGAGGGDSGGILAFWDLESEKPIHKAKPKGHLQHFTFDAECSRILAAGHGGFQVWAFDGEKEQKDHSDDS